MKRILAAVALISALGIVWHLFDFVFNRAPPHHFMVKLDEDARSVELALGNSERRRVALMTGGPREYSDSRNIGDASGYIRVIWRDNSETRCLIGYITNGEREPHTVTIKKRNCPKISSNV